MVPAVPPRPASTLTPVGGHPGNRDDLRRNNLAAVLARVHARGGVSRAALTRELGLNRSTVGALVAELDDLGLVRQGPPDATDRVGRPSLVVAPRPEGTSVLAMSVGSDHLVAARVGLGGQVLARRSVRTTPGAADPRATVRRLGRLAEAVLRGAPAGHRVVGVGVAVCGLVRTSDNVVRLAPNLGWVDVPLGQAVEHRLGGRWHVAVGNDADLGCVAEQARGAAQGAQNAVYLSGEVGVGAGIVVDGRALSGVGGYAGEVGHMVVRRNGRPCRCGNRGCWETEVGEEPLLALVPGAVTVAEVVAAASRDRRVRSGVRRAGRSLGVGLANLVNLFNPEVVVLGGQLRDLYPAVADEVTDGLGAALLAPREHVRVELAGLGQDSTLLGAAELGFAPLLTDPVGLLAG